MNGRTLVGSLAAFFGIVLMVSAVNVIDELPADAGLGNWIGTLSFVLIGLWLLNRGVKYTANE